MSTDVGIIMGSRSDWETMQHATKTLDALGVKYEVRVVSAHRTPDLLFEYASTAVERGLKVIIAAMLQLLIVRSSPLFLSLLL